MEEGAFIQSVKRLQGLQAAGLAVPSWLTLNCVYPTYPGIVAAANQDYNQSPFLLLCVVRVTTS